MQDEDYQDKLKQWLEALTTDEIVYVPIRHHSPHCARHLDALLRQARPSAVLIEGPHNFGELLPVLTHEENRLPLAVYCSFNDNRWETLPKPTKEERNQSMSPRYVSFYPLCDYSPEWVAMKTGAELGAQVQFIDLTFAEKILAEANAHEEVTPDRVNNLLNDSLLQHNAYLRELALRSGCRDFDDFWDRRFEFNDDFDSPAKFFRALATYCFFARQFSDPEAERLQANADREAAMAHHIRTALDKRIGGPIIVVTGGFHTVALPNLVAGKPKKFKPRSFGEKDVVQVPVAYSYPQLDRLNGYGAGMPAPDYYGRVWEKLREGGSEAVSGEVAKEFFVTLARITRESGKGAPLSTADVIAAQVQCAQLAKMRGQTHPSREDLLDAIRSCFIKGAIDIEGQLVLALAEKTLTGDRVGHVAEAAGVLPIIGDFRRRATRSRISLEPGAGREVALNIYRTSNARDTSYFLHCLEFLEVPFARLLRGPDFMHQTELHRLQEIWDVSWSPQTDGALVEASIYGGTVAEAALCKLKESWHKQQQAGEARDASTAVHVLVRGCQMGLHDHLEPVLAELPAAIAEDPNFASLARATRELLLLEMGREPLQAERLREVPQLLRAGFERCCFLIPDLAQCPDDRADEELNGLTGLPELVEAKHEGFDQQEDDAEDSEISQAIDEELLWDALERLANAVPCQSLLCGGACGLLHARGRLDTEQLGALTNAYLRSGGLSAENRVSFLRGLFVTCREVLWQSKDILQAITQLFKDWSEDEFLNSIPQLRLAFSGLSPRETDDVAALVAKSLGVEAIGPVIHTHLSEKEIMHATQLSKTVLETIQADGLREWFQPREDAKAKAQEGEAA